MGEEKKTSEDGSPPGDAGLTPEEKGQLMFGACYVKYARTRKELVESDRKELFGGNPKPRGFKPDVEDMEFTRGTMKNMVIGSIATSLGAMTSYAGYKRFIKPGPTSALWLGGLAFVGSIAGAAAAATGSLASEVLTLESQPIKVSDRDCPAFIAFRGCTQSQECVDFADKHVATQRLLDGFEICKERAIQRRKDLGRRDKLDAPFGTQSATNG